MIALGCLSLTGCFEEETSSRKKEESINRLNVNLKISEFLHSFVPKSAPPLEMPLVKTEPEVPEDIEDVPHYEMEDLYDDTIFGDEAQVLLPFRTKDEQSKRYESLLQRKSTSILKPEKSKTTRRLNAKDKDYKTHLKDIKKTSA